MITIDDAVAGAIGTQPEKAKRDPIDDAVGQVLQGEKAQQRMTLQAAARTNPDQASEAARLARRYPAPEDVILRNLQDVRVQAAVDDADAKLGTSPKLAGFLRAKPFAAAQSHDDIDSLSLYETLANSFRRGIPGLKQNFSATALRANANALADLDRVEATLAAGGRVLDSADPAGVQYMTQEQRAQYRAALGQAAGGNAANIAAQQAERALYPSPAVTQSVMQAKTFGDAISAFLTDPVKFIASIGPESLVQNAPGLAAGAVIPGGAAMKASTMGAGSFVTDYGSSLLDALSKQGVDLNNPEALAKAAKDARLMQRVAAQAMAHATIVGTVDAASGGLASRLVLPAKVLTKAPVARELANLATQTPIQGAFGGLGEAGGQVAAGQDLDPGNILAEIVGEGFHAPAEVATIAAGNVRERMAQAKQAKADAIETAQLLETAKASKLRQRDPATFAEFANAAADDAEVFIDAKAFAQSVPPAKLAELPKEITEQLAEAQTTGGDIAIKVGDLAAYLADVPELVQHIRKTPEAMSQAEAQAFNPDDELRAEVDRLFPPEPALEPRAEAVAQARQSVADALAKVGRFTPQANAQYTELLSAFIATSAERNNLTPAEIQGLVPRIVSQLENPGSGSAFEQSTPAAPSVADWRARWEEKGLSLSVGERKDRIELSRIVVPEGQRGSGLGTQAMQELVGIADQLGLHVTLSPSPDFGGNKKRLTAFYKRFGFVENKGRNRAFTTLDSMYRTAPGKVLEQPARGLYAPDSKTIALLRDADLSTFLHESGHFFLDAIATQAQRADAPAEVKADMQTVLDWFGVKDLATWQGMTIDQQREHHERFAGGFEAYLMEGKAPTTELARVFARFRGWLTALYRKLTALNVELTPEVRAVMDRMLATDAQIAETAARRGGNPLFPTAEAAGMSPEDFAAYQAQGQQAIEDAVASLQGASIRDLQFIANSKARALRKLNTEAKAKRAAIEEQVTAEVNALPIYQVWRDLARGHTEDGQPVRLSLPELEETHPELVERLPHGVATNDPNAMPADLVAEAYGLTSGDELVKLLATLDKPADVSEARTDQLMLERHGELYDPAALERAAHAAIANDARARVLATESNALAKAVGGPQLVTRAAREFAEAAIARRKVRELRPGQFTAAEARAGREAAAAFKRGDLATAANAKREQTLQHMLAKTTAATLAEVERAVDYLGRFDSAATRKAIGPEYADQIDQLLERVDLRKGESLKAIDKRKSLAAWVESQQAVGLEPNIPPELLVETQRKNYRELTVEELRGLTDTIKQIEHLGRLKNKLLTAKDRRKFDAVREDLVASITSHAGDRKADTRTPTTNLGRTLQGLRAFGFAHIKAATWARILDGGKDGGPVWERIIRPANEAGDKEVRMRAEASKALSDILAPVLAAGKMGGAGRFFPSIKRSLNREAVFAIALNTGNEPNLQRLLGGEGWTLAQIEPVLATLSATDWRAVQAVWDYFESFRPQIAEKQRRVYGIEPEWIEPGSEVTRTRSGLKGGYYPVRFDPAASIRAEEHADAEAARAMLKGAYGSATTRRSFTKSRVEEVTGRPLLYSLSGLYSGVNEVIHDLSWHEWLIDTNRLLRSAAVDAAIREHYGPEVVQQFKSWREKIAEGDAGLTTALDRAVGRLRQGVSAAGLGFNVMSALIQPLGLTQSIVRVGAPWIGKGIAHYVASPLAATREAKEKSSFLAERTRTRFRELNELRNRVEGQGPIGTLATRYAYLLMMQAQQVVDIPTWWGAYEKAVAEGNQDDRAVALADQAVIDSQGGGQTKDLSAIEAGGPLAKTMTTFYSFMNTALNLGVVSGATATSRAKLSADMLLLYVVPPVLGSLLKDALTPGDSGDDDDLRKLAQKLAAEQMSYLLGLMVVTREFSELGRVLAGQHARGYSGPSGLRVIPDAQAAAKQAAQGELDDAFRKAMVNLVGDVTGLPAAQINRTITGVQALNDGKTGNPAAAVFGYQEPH